jgi:hypothetical protein
MIDRDDKSTLVTKIIRRIQQSALQRERAAIVCLLAKRCNMRGDCSYLQSECFIRSVAVRVCSLRNLVCFFAVLVRPVTGFIRRGFISRISTLSHRRFTLVVWISPNRQFTTSRIRRAG